MSRTYKRIVALRPANTSEQALYLVPTSNQVVANLRICNQDTLDSTFSVAHCNATGAASGEDWIEYNTSIFPGIPVDVSIFANEAEEIRVVAGTADKISFVLTGLLIDNS